MTNPFAFSAAGSSELVDDLTGLPFEIGEVRLTTYDGLEVDLTLRDGVTRIADRNGN